MLPLFDTTSQRNSIICSDSAQGKTGVEILRLKLRDVPRNEQRPQKRRHRNTGFDLC
jgi:hypothetical protein